MAHTHDVYDMESHFEINGSSRFIKETSSTKLVLVQGDHKSEVLTFKMPRYIDGHDMLECNKVRVHYINIETGTNNKSADLYEVTDMALCEDSEDVITFTWTVEAPATKYYGPLSFLVKFECTEGSNVLYQWNTAKYVGVNVLAGIDNSEEFVDKYSNVLEEWYNKLTNGANTIEEMNEQSIAEIAVAKENAKNAIEDKTRESLMFFSENARVMQGYKIIDLYVADLEWVGTSSQVYVQHVFNEANSDNIAWCTAKEVKILNYGVIHTVNDTSNINGGLADQYYRTDEDLSVVLNNVSQDDNPKWTIFCNMWKDFGDSDVLPYVYYKVTIAYSVAIDNDNSISDEQIAEAVNAYLEENPVQSGATEEQAKQIKQNTTDIGKLQEENVDKANSLWAIVKKMAFVAALTEEEINTFKTKWGITEESGGEEEPDEPVEPTVTLSSISATYTGGEVTVGTALTDLTGITVTAHYSDGSTSAITGYTLSGTIVEGSNTITVSYGGKTATFTVTGITESGGEAEPLYTFESVENAEIKSAYNNHTGAVTVSNGNHVKILCSEATEWFWNINLSSALTNGASGTSSGASATDTWFTIPAGANVKLCAKNIQNNSKSIARLAVGAGSSVHNTYKFADTNLTVEEFEFSVESDTSVPCITCSAKQGAKMLDGTQPTGVDIEFDVELYVNDVRWI